MDKDKVFSNGKWAINVRTVGEAIKELSLLDPAMPLNQEYEGNGADIVVMNRKQDDTHVAFSEGGFWDESVEMPED